MKKDFNLKSLDSEKVLSFTWDNETGEISGKDAYYLNQLIQSTDQVITPMPGQQSISIPDVITNVDHLALLLGGDWEVPGDWPDYIGNREPPGTIF